MVLKEAKNCKGCSYLRTGKNDTEQVCGKYFKKKGKPILHKCPAQCQFPYPRDAYNQQVVVGTEVIKNYNGLYDDVQTWKVDSDKLIKNINNLRTYLNVSSDEEGKKNINNKFVKYGPKTETKSIPRLDNLKCGKLAKPKTEKEGGLGFIKFPVAPTRAELRKVILSSTDKGISIYRATIDWKKVKLTPLLRKKYTQQISADKSMVNLSNGRIPIADNGIQLEWWEKKTKNYTDEELLTLIPGNIRAYVDLKFIHASTGAGLQKFFTTHTVKNMVLEEVYDWLRMKDLGIKEKVKTTISKSDPLYPFYNVESNTSSIRYEFEQCMNDLMQTEHDDEQHIKKLKEMNHFSDLGDPENRLELDYVHAKIVKFLILDHRDFNNCINILYVTEKICKRGISTNLMELMGNFLNMNTMNMDNEEYRDNMDVVSNKLLRYVPEVLKKIINISEHYEKYKCNGKVNENTLLLKKVHKNLFNKPMMMDMPDLGLETFFKSFNKNIITKIILLAFITYIFVKIIGLFRINYNMKESN